MKSIIPNVLADRYATPEMVYIWSVENKIKIERRFWIAALKAQRDLGLHIPQKAIDAYESVVDNIDLEAIRAKEIQRRHDVIARIESFNELTIEVQKAMLAREDQFARQEEFEKLAGYQLIHDPFTSRDLTDCTEQYQIYESMKLIRFRVLATLVRFQRRASEYQFIAMMGRSHNVAAQAITMGKRFANWAEELLLALHRLDQLIADYPLRGIKGPMGTQQDIITKLGSYERALAFEKEMQEHLGLPALLTSVGQVYPRSLDFEVISRLAQLSSGPGNMAKTMRLMAGIGLATEGFSKFQKGSSAMPHKRNARTSERINGMVAILGGYLSMSQSLLGDEWNEGDVSCSIVRRVALPDSFFAMDGLLEATMTVLDEMGVYEEAIANELQTNLPFLSTTAILSAMTKTGMGRQDAHTMIRDAAIEAVQAGQPETFIDRLASAEGMPLTREELEAQVAQANPGASALQVQAVCLKIAVVLETDQGAKDYNPYPIL